MATGLLEIGEIMLTGAHRRLEIASNNVANAQTPGFKRALVYEEAYNEARLATGTDLAQGPLQSTGAAFDLAITGDGFFLTRSEDRYLLTRGGAFSRTSEGRLATAQGYVLQALGGGDLILEPGAAQIQSDGTVVQAGQPIARIGVFAPGEDGAPRSIGGALFEPGELANLEQTNALIRQGMLESANVDMAGEMLDMMGALRTAEAGAKVVEVYDTLMGQSITTFGRNP